MLKSGPTRHFEGVSNQTFNALPGIVFAGTIYVVVLTIVWSVWWLPQILSGPIVLSGLILNAAAGLVIVVIASIFCFASVGFVVTIAMTIFNMTLSYTIPALTAGGLIGGITGFVIGAASAGILGYSIQGTWGSVLLFFLGPGLCTLICHLGAWYQVRKFHYLLAAEALPEEELSEQSLNHAVAKFDSFGTLPSQFPLEPEQPVVTADKVHPLDEPDEAPPEASSARPILQSSPVQHRRHGQWSLRQVFVLMTWVGVFAAFAAAMPQPGGALALAFGTYCAIQLLSFALLFVVWKRLDRRLGRVIIRFFQQHRVPVVGP